jgi:tartrate dehydrogenase/decarboxylase/D-malate dehydrogenase
VLDAVGAKFGFGLEYQHFDWSCETYRTTGRMMPEDGLARLRDQPPAMRAATCP